jgi:hypothetical protein
MDITPQGSTQQPISDDQELAKALAGVLDDPMPEPVVAPLPAPEPEPAMNFEETPAAVVPTPVMPTMPAPAAAPAEPAPGDLASLKMSALNELRPLMDKVELPAADKFDTYLMLIRSTDDASLVGPAHTAALAIEDEKRRATALLEIIKEIDYLSSPDKTAA